jgi:MinD superfamily P-loop ATPase
MKIAITGGKGGTGKSMVAVSLAVEFAQNKKTLLADADVECPNDHLILGAERKNPVKIYQPVPKWDFDKCDKCGQCAAICKQNAIVFVKNKFPAFVSEICIGCKACLAVCPKGAISIDKKEIGLVYGGRNYNVDLVSGELKLGEMASGEVVAEVRKFVQEEAARLGSEIILIDSAAGVGCPVIASLTGTDYIVGVTEPTPSALHDLKRVLYLARHFKIKHGIVINKFDLETDFCVDIERFAQENGAPVIGKIPYRKDFVDASLKMKPVGEIYPEYKKIFREIIANIEEKSK